MTNIHESDIEKIKSNENFKKLKKIVDEQLAVLLDPIQDDLNKTMANHNSPAEIKLGISDDDLITKMFEVMKKPTQK